jgi:aminoglycoside phosphotransferase (APT) family kinase protein
VRHPGPSSEALAWVCEQIGARSRVASVRALPGRSFHANHALDVVDGAGAAHALVLRQWAGADWQRHDADFDAHREAAVLRLLEGSAVLAPRLVASDPAGVRCGKPSLLVTRLPGAPPAAGRGRRLLAGLAGCLAAIHSVPGAARVLPAYRRYHEPADRVLPAWAQGRTSWAAAVERVAGPPPEGRTCLIHRDFHPGNTLWLEDRLVGVVDWSYASFGPAAVDTAHLRWNLALDSGVEAADALLATAPAPPHHAYWDLVDLLDLVADPATALSEAQRGRLETYLESVLAKQGADASKQESWRFHPSCGRSGAARGKNSR